VGHVEPRYVKKKRRIVNRRYGKEKGKETVGILASGRWGKAPHIEGGERDSQKPGEAA